MELLKKSESGKGVSHVKISNPESFKGKEFIKDATGATSCEISFGSLEPGEAVPFFHSHKQNEENYIILKGSGDFQADNEVFSISPGSIIRVSAECKRSMRCTSDETMVYICIQAKENSLEQYTMEDGIITEHTAAW